MALDFRRVSLDHQRSEIVDLNVEYMTWVLDGVDAHFSIDSKALAGKSVREYVESTIDAALANATLYLLYDSGALVGMGALRKIRDDVGELKRMYVRPAFRGRGFGKALLAKLLDDARAMSLKTLYLDSAPFMTAAHGLYRSIGFEVCDAYPESEVPEHLRSQWLFMQATL